MAVPAVMPFPESASAAATKKTPICRVPPAKLEAYSTSTFTFVRFLDAVYTPSLLFSWMREMLFSALKLLITEKPVSASFSMPV